MLRTVCLAIAMTLLVSGLAYAGGGGLLGGLLGGLP